MPQFIYPPDLVEGGRYDREHQMGVGAAKAGIEHNAIRNAGQAALCASLIAHLLRSMPASLDMDTSAADLCGAVVSIFGVLNMKAPEKVDELAEAFGVKEAMDETMKAAESDIEPCVCPNCGAEQTKGLAVNGSRAPRPGDVSLCAECVEFAVFDEKMQLRKPTEHEAALLRADPLSQRSQTALRRAKASIEGEAAGHA